MLSIINLTEQRGRKLKDYKKLTDFEFLDLIV